MYASENSLGRLCNWVSARFILFVHRMIFNMTLAGNLASPVLLVLVFRRSLELPVFATFAKFGRSSPGQTLAGRWPNAGRTLVERWRTAGRTQVFADLSQAFPEVFLSPELSPRSFRICQLRKVAMWLRATEKQEVITSELQKFI